MSEKYKFRVRLKMLRKEYRLTQAELAARLHLTESLIRKYENGCAFPCCEGLIELSRFFSVSTDYLLGISDIPIYEPTELSVFTTDELLAELKRRCNY